MGTKWVPPGTALQIQAARRSPVLNREPIAVGRGVTRQGHQFFAPRHPSNLEQRTLGDHGVTDSRDTGQVQRRQLFRVVWMVG